MSAVARGRRRHYKNYKCKKLTNNRNVEYEYNDWKSKGKPGKAMFGSDNAFAKSIVVDDVKYGSMSEASLATGLSMYKLRKLKGYENGNKWLYEIVDDNLDDVNDDDYVYVDEMVEDYDGAAYPRFVPCQQ